MFIQFRRWWLIGAALIGGLSLVGCSSNDGVNNATVQGSVTIDGELAKSGSVTFNPEGRGPVAVGEIHADGSYSLRVGQGNLRDPDSSKIPAGEYVVTVMVTGPTEKSAEATAGAPPSNGPRLVALKYTTKKTSDLKYKVEAGSNIFNLTLLGTSADPPPDEDADKKETDGANEGTAPKSPENQAPATAEPDSAGKSEDAPPGASEGNGAPITTAEPAASAAASGAEPAAASDVEGKQ
jgi:hypothetical protein